MAVANSSIEWTDATWNPLTGCTKVSPGCDHCYAEVMHERFNGKGSFATVTLRPERLDQPLRWRKPRRIFVNSMSDLFHKDVPDAFVARVFAVMALAPHHTFQVLTKRHGRMRSLLNSHEFLVDVMNERIMLALGRSLSSMEPMPWPLPNAWLGVSVEDQQRADLRIPALLDTPAAVRWISAEPLLGPVELEGSLVRVHPNDPGHRPNLTYWLYGRPGFGEPYPSPSNTKVLVREQTVGPHLDWVVVGGESGHGARAMHPDWARSLRDQCSAAGVPFLYKQTGEWAPHPGTDATHAFTGGLLPDGTQHFMPLDHPATSGERDAETPPGAQGMRRVGKKAAGRELDGRTWDEYPAVTG